MDEEEKKARLEKLRKGVSIVHFVRRMVMYGFDELDDFNDFMKSAIKKEQSLTSERLKKGASGLGGEELEQYWEVYAETTKR